ncbi:MAG: prepilin-type N-terminal cleavage/methylation domain-containing protein [Patescibacteria group bacterium]
MSSTARIKRSMRRIAGFTIIELLVATAVFGTVLLVATTGVMQLSRVYYKGVTERNTQNTARSIADLIAQSIQFNGGSVTTTPATPTPGNEYAFCVGNQQYSYSVGYEVADSPVAGKFQKRHALVVRDLAGCTSSSAAQDLDPVAVIGRELMRPGMRLASLQITNAGTDLYRISVRVVYGDDSVLTSPATAAAAKCQSIRAGTQFCAISDLTTVVTKRVE